MKKLSKSLEVINELINSSDYAADNVYTSVIFELFSLFKDIQNKACAVFFLEDLKPCLKTAYNNSKIIDNYEINSLYVQKLINSKNPYTLIKTQQDELLYDNTILLKLAIKKSVFGFIVFSIDNDFTKEDINILNTLSCVISYKIKDFELNDVFKMQLKAMQDAVIEKNEAFEVIKKQHKKLQELDKAKNLFLANISHELRTPLNAILGFSQALDSKIFGDLNEKQSEYINDIQISGLHLLGMINEILDISKLEANAMKFTPSNISANQVIQEVVNILEPLYKNKNISVEFISEYKGEIFADYQKIQQILYNLLSNAIKFTNNNGKIVIKSYANKNIYYLEVSDNGVGIDKKYHNRIFKKFVHLDNLYVKNQASTGLGLTITKELVKLHRGKITLISELNKGTTFKMEFKNILV